MNYGLSQMSKGDYKEAEKCFTKALEMWPYYSFLHVNMAILKAATGDDKMAEVYFKNSISYGTKIPDSWYFYGNFLAKQKRYAEAIPLLDRKSTRLNSSHIQKSRMPSSA